MEALALSVSDTWFVWEKGEEAPPAELASTAQPQGNSSDLSAASFVCLGLLPSPTPNPSFSPRQKLLHPETRSQNHKQSPRP